MIVYKFGGALARTKRGMDALVRLTQEAYRKELARAKRQKTSVTTHGLVLVVSAIGHTTRHLSRAAELAERGELSEAEQALDRSLSQHEMLAGQLGILDTVADSFYTITTEVRSLLEGIAIVRELSPRTRDAVLAAGEELAAALIVALLEVQELPVRFVDARHLIVTDESHGNAAALAEETEHNVRQRVLPRLHRHDIVLTQGFVGATRDGITTTMGAESSDLTATLLAGALAASEVVIWKSLPGLYTADPELVPTARLIRSLSFDEAEELGRRGARILYPSFAHPLLSAEAKTLLRIATPFGKAGRHTMLQRTIQSSRNATSQKALALAVRQRLILLRMRPLSEADITWLGNILPKNPGRPTGGKRQSSSVTPVIQWSTPLEHFVLIQKEDRAAFVREVEAAKMEVIGSERAVAVISLILRKPAEEAADPRFAAALGRSLRAFHTHALLPVEQSVVAIVDEAGAVAGLKKAHHDLIEV